MHIKEDIALTLHQFSLVKALATHLHFGKGAAALDVSQPSLTRGLKDFEARLGVALFDRQGVQPNLFGEMVLRYGEPVISNVSELLREIELSKGL